MRTLLHLCSDRTSTSRPWLVGMLPDGDGDPAAGGGGGAPAGEPAKTFTQADVDRMTTEARDRGKRQAIADLATKFGMSPDEAAAKFKELQDAETARLSEVERREKAAADKEAQAAADKAAADEKSLAADVRTALADAGATGDNQADAATLIRGAIDANADAAAIKTAVESLRKRRPELFAAKVDADKGDGDKGDGAPSTTPPAGPSPRPSGVRSIDKGREEARKHFGLPAPNTKTA